MTFRENNRLLLVEDDPNLGFVIRDNLEESGFDVRWIKNGKEAFQVFFENEFDLCILDVMLPGKDGFSLAREIRQIDLDVPIIFLTAKSMKDDKAEGFGLGGDDYLTKPFEMAELILRIEALQRRVRRAGNDQKNQKDEFQLGKLNFNYRNLLISGPDDYSQNLTKKEAELLRLLAIHKNETLEREVALKLIWGEHDYFLGRSMDVFITKLRKYLKADPEVKIENVHGVGFKLIT